jgi:RHS repeat-associated protein
MDALVFHYQKASAAPGAPRLNNRLLHVNEKDPSIDTRFSSAAVQGGVKDLDDQGNAAAGNNYEYDKDGRLTRDLSEGLQRILWNHHGRITAIHRSAADPVADIVYLYDGLRNRVAKIVRGSGADSTTFKYEYFVRDARGAVVAAYGAEAAANALPTPSLTDHPIYAGKRLGTWLAPTNPVATAGAFAVHAGDKRYELTEHRESVLATVSDLRSGQQAQIKSAHDFYPFGAARPYRFNSEVGQRYAFSGLELDRETKDVGNSYYAVERNYDPRVGRWLSPDPEWLSQGAQGLNVYQYGFNSPINFFDRDGKAPVKNQLGSPAMVSRILTGRFSRLDPAWVEPGRNPFRGTSGPGAYARYVPAEGVPGGFIDMQHFLAAAAEAKKIGYGPIGATVTHWLGLGLEVSQAWRGYFDDNPGVSMSAFSSEDVPSNAYGAEFGALHYDESKPLGPQVKTFLEKRTGAIRPSEFKKKHPEEYKELPRSEKHAVKEYEKESK